MSTLKTTNIQHPSAGSPAIELTAAGGLWLGGGKVLQVVRATDSTSRYTTSTSFVDATGMSVSITPQKSDSAIILIMQARQGNSASSNVDLRSHFQWTDSSNNAISGAESMQTGAANMNTSANPRLAQSVVLIGYATPATTSSVTYKIRFRSEVSSCTTEIVNASNTAQMFAIEVSA